MALQYVTWWMPNICTRPTWSKFLGHNGMGWKWQRRFIHIWSGGEKFENFWNSLWQLTTWFSWRWLPSSFTNTTSTWYAELTRYKRQIADLQKILTLMSTRLLRMVTSSLRSDNWSPCSLHPTTVASSTMLVSESPPLPHNHVAMFPWVRQFPEPALLF